MSGYEKVASLLREAKQRIEELEKENEQLRQEKKHIQQNQSVEKIASYEEDSRGVSMFGEIDDSPTRGISIDSSKALDILLNEGRLPDEI
jgi:cell shape-determining protein MreC